MAERNSRRLYGSFKAHTGGVTLAYNFVDDKLYMQTLLGEKRKITEARAARPIVKRTEFRPPIAFDSRFRRYVVRRTRIGTVSARTIDRDRIRRRTFSGRATKFRTSVAAFFLPYENYGRAGSINNVRAAVIVHAVIFAPVFRREPSLTEI